MSEEARIEGIKLIKRTIVTELYKKDNSHGNLGAVLVGGLLIFYSTL
jgi:hypothetical protein